MPSESAQLLISGAYPCAKDVSGLLYVVKSYLGDTGGHCMPDLAFALWPSSLFSCCTGPCPPWDLSEAACDEEELPSDPEAICELRKPEGGKKGPHAPKPISTLRTVLLQGLQAMLIY
jgi:hypothetical protein